MTSVTINTDKTEYKTREEIVLSGTVDPVDSNFPVTIIIRDETNNIVQREKTRPNSDGTWVTRTFLTSPGTFNLRPRYHDADPQQGVSVTVTPHELSGDIRVEDIRFVANNLEHTQLSTGFHYDLEFELVNNLKVEGQAPTPDEPFGDNQPAANFDGIMRTVITTESDDILLDNTKSIKLGPEEIRAFKTKFVPLQGGNINATALVTVTGVHGHVYAQNSLQISISGNNVIPPKTVEERLTELEYRVAELENQ